MRQARSHSVSPASAAHSRAQSLNTQTTRILNSSPSEHCTWQRDLARAIRSVDALLERLNLPIDAIVALQDPDILARFPVLVPESYIQRMQPADPQDPLLLQVFPQAEEAVSVPGFTTDAVGDLHARKSPGLLQKYEGRVLLITTRACAIHCRYCFRRDYPYELEPRRLEEWLPSIQRIEEDPSISEVILSGGDPLMLNDDRLSELCRAIDRIPHVERIRFHTRLPIVLPSRVTDEFIQLLRSLRAQPIMVIHSNHANELQNDCAEAVQALSRSGIPVLNQAVLMRGVNDTLQSQENLCRRLLQLGAIPYYLHQLDQVTGTHQFAVSEEEGKALIDRLKARLPGYAVPRYVREIAGHASKTSIR